MCRVPDAVSAAGFGAGRWLVIFGLALMLVAPTVRLAASYVLRGEVSPSPLTTPGSADGELTVENADAEERALVRRAVDDLALRFDPSGVTVRVVEDVGGCDTCLAVYLPEMREILVPRSLVRLGGAQLRWALAHELGHYVDSRYMSDPLRARFSRLREHPAEATWLSLDRDWTERPSEDFAEVFALLVQPTVERPPGTVYGRLRDAAPVEELLAEADLRSAPPPESPWTIAVEEQSTYLAETMRDPMRLEGLRLLALASALVGATHAVIRSWRAPRCGPVAP